VVGTQRDSCGGQEKQCVKVVGWGNDKGGTRARGEGRANCVWRGVMGVGGVKGVRGSGTEYDGGEIFLFENFVSKTTTREQD